MKPLYFPYTFVSRQTALEVSAFFEKFVVFQPSEEPLPEEMQTLADGGLLDVQIPDTSNASRFRAVVNNFQRWGNQQRSSDEIQAAVLRSSTDPVPLYDDSSASRIVSDLRRQLESPQAGDIMSKAFEARVFLAFAQEFDREHQEITGDLGDYKDKTRHLIANFNAGGTRPVKEPLSELEIRQSDSAEYMLFQRLQAWAKVHAQGPADTGILLTSSSAVLEHVSAQIPGVETFHEFTSAPVSDQKDESFTEWRKNLLRYLVDLAQIQWPAAPNPPPDGFNPKNEQANLSLSVHLIPDLAPRDCLARCISPSPANAAGGAEPVSVRNTVIGLIRHLKTSK
jgi:hypothetical protein